MRMSFQLSLPLTRFKDVLPISSIPHSSAKTKGGEYFFWLALTRAAYESLLALQYSSSNEQLSTCNSASKIRRPNK